MKSTGPSGFEVRPAKAVDVPALAAVHLASWLACYRGLIADSWLDSLSTENFAAYHRPRFAASWPHGVDPNEPFVVAMEGSGDRIVGLARGGPTRALSPTGDPLAPGFAERFSAEVYAIYVHPAMHGRGIGRMLMQRIAGDLLNLDHASLCIWVLAGNAGARGFYERLGGVQVERGVVTLGGVAYPQVAYGWKDIRVLTAAG